MKKLFLISISFFVLTSFTNRSNNGQIAEPQVGDTLVVLKNKGDRYRHIDFPRLNMIVKRGGVANYKSVYGIKVVIDEVFENSYGRVDVKLKRADGKKFFNHQSTVIANYSKAMEAGELKAK